MKYGNLDEAIAYFREKNKLIVVEGKKDKCALNKLGFTQIHSLKKPIYLEAEEIAKKNKDVMIMTDLDREGKKLYGKLNNELARLGVRVDNSFREFILKETTLRQIEGLCSYMEKQAFDDVNYY